MTGPRGRLAAAAALALLVTGCGGAPQRVQDTARCPGPDCTDDARARFEAIAALDGVTAVRSVTRSHDLDHGTARSAAVAAAVTSRAAAREVGRAVLRQLEDWPGHADGVATVEVVADPAVPVSGVVRDTVDLTTAFYEPCSPAECAASRRRLRRQVAAASPGLERATVELAAGPDLLRVRARVPQPRAELAARAVVRVLEQVGVRVAERVEIEIRWRGSLTLRLRLEDGLVCDQPPGVIAGCDPALSTRLGGDPTGTPSG